MHHEEEIKLIGIKIRELRKLKCISQEKLAFNCELDRSYIGSVERGERNISLKTLIKITNELGVSLSEFFKDFNNG